jgi:hypothetical protein
MMTATPNAASTPAAPARTHGVRDAISSRAATADRTAATTIPIQFHAAPWLLMLNRDCEYA